MELKGDMERFAHLLKPLRNIAENWEIDVAVELESMLHANKGSSNTDASKRLSRWRA